MSWAGEELWEPSWQTKTGYLEKRVVPGQEEEEEEEPGWQ